MPETSSSPLQWVLRTLIVFTPWVVSAFILYWLELSQSWTLDTPHRGKISVAILATGLILSFLVKSRFDKKS